MHPTLVLPIAQTDDMILSVIEGELLVPGQIDELVSLVHSDRTDEGARLSAERARLTEPRPKGSGGAAGGIGGRPG